MTEAVAAHDPAAARGGRGGSARRVRAEFVRIASVDAAGTGVRAGTGTFVGRD